MQVWTGFLVSTTIFNHEDEEGIYVFSTIFNDEDGEGIYVFSTNERDPYRVSLPPFWVGQKIAIFVALTHVVVVSCRFMHKKTRLKEDGKNISHH